jgi:carbon monoxide dehydrogenase subunit G
MPEATNTVVIARPVADVFAFFTDPANDPDWRAGVKSIRAEGDPAVGAVVHQTIAGPMGRGVPANIEITAYDAERRYAFKGVAGPVRPIGDFAFSEVDGGTKVTFTLSAELGRLSRRILGKQVQKAMDDEVAGLAGAKALLEG